MDLVLNGHDHTYARTGDLAGRAMVGTENVPEGYRQAWDPNIGTVYVVSVSGPKMYAQEHTDWAVRRAEDTQLFQVITVDGDELRYQARTATGRLYDAFTLRKRAGLPNALLEVLPRKTAANPPRPRPRIAPFPSPPKWRAWARNLVRCSFLEKASATRQPPPHDSPNPRPRFDRVQRSPTAAPSPGAAFRFQRRDERPFIADAHSRERIRRPPVSALAHNPGRPSMCTTATATVIESPSRKRSQRRRPLSFRIRTRGLLLEEAPLIASCL